MQVRRPSVIQLSWKLLFIYMILFLIKYSKPISTDKMSMLCRGVQVPPSGRELKCSSSSVSDVDSRTDTLKVLQPPGQGHQEQAEGEPHHVTSAALSRPSCCLLWKELILPFFFQGVQPSLSLFIFLSSASPWPVHIFSFPLLLSELRTSSLMSWKLTLKKGHQHSDCYY